MGSEDQLLADIAGHLIEAGGKRLRPSLTVMAALAAGAEITDDLVRGAVSVELVHLGSLYHDDVIDEAPTRRGVESVNARWGNLMAIVAGDFLLARASEIAASLGTEVSGLLAHTIGRLCEGEVGEIQFAIQLGPHRSGVPDCDCRENRFVDVDIMPDRRPRGERSPGPGRSVDRVRAGVRHGVPDL